jgi:hypothetical protein
MSARSTGREAVTVTVPLTGSTVIDATPSRSAIAAVSR